MGTGVRNTETGAWATNPVHERDGAWYFWDETWSEEHGPYDSVEGADEACGRYARDVLG